MVDSKENDEFGREVTGLKPWLPNLEPALTMERESNYVIFS